MDTDHSDSHWHPVTALCSGVEKELRLFANGLWLLADATVSVEEIRDPVNRAIAHAQIAGAAASVLPQDTEHIRFAAKELKNIESFHAPDEHNWEELESDYPELSGLDALQKDSGSDGCKPHKSAALAAIAVAYFRAGYKDRVKEVLHRIPTRDVKIITCSEIHERAKDCGDLDLAAEVLEIAEAETAKERGLSDCAGQTCKYEVPEEHTPEATVASLGAAGRPEASRTPQPGSPPDSVPILAAIKREMAIEWKDIDAINYAFDGFYDVAEGKALEFGISLDGCVALAVIGALEVVAGLDGTRLFSLAKYIASMDQTELLDWVMLAGRTKRAEERAVAIFQAKEEWRDDALVKISGIEAETGRDLCQKARDSLGQLSREDRIGLLAQYRENTAVLRTLGAFLSVDEIDDAMNCIEEKRRDYVSSSAITASKSIADLRRSWLPHSLVDGMKQEIEEEKQEERKEEQGLIESQEIPSEEFVDWLGKGPFGRALENTFTMWPKFTLREWKSKTPLVADGRLRLSLNLLAGQELVHSCIAAEPYGAEAHSYVPIARRNRLVAYFRTYADVRQRRSRRSARELKLTGKTPSGKTLSVYRKKNATQVLIRKTIDSDTLPFALNSAMGCLFGCSYCYLRMGRLSRHAKFGEEMVVREELIGKLRTELRNLRELPQHLRRVQIGSETEVYHPLLLKAFEKNRRSGLMSNVLNAFLREQEAGYTWAIHLITKSPLIEKDIDLLTQLACLQAEITIPTLSDEGRSLWEGRAPSVEQRLETVRKLSDEGIFVRVVAEPVFAPPEAIRALQKRLACADESQITSGVAEARWAEARAIQAATELRGAMAFKAREITPVGRRDVNEWDLEAGRAVTITADPAQVIRVHSGETLLKDDGTEETVEAETWWYEEGEKKRADGSLKKVKRLLRQEPRMRQVMDFGYHLMDKAKHLDWGDCRCSGKRLSWRQLQEETKQREEVIEASPSFFMFAWCPYCKQDLRVTTDYMARDANGKRYRNCRCTNCRDSFAYYFENLNLRGRFPVGRFQLDDDLFTFLEKHSEVLTSLRLSDPRYYFVPHKAVATQRYAGSSAANEVIGLFYVDQLHLHEGRKPLFVQDCVVNLGARNEEYVVYTEGAERGRYVRPAFEVLSKYGHFDWYYPADCDRPWFPTYDDVDDLPEKVQEMARRAIDAVSPALQPEY